MSRHFPLMQLVPKLRQMVYERVLNEKHSLGSEHMLAYVQGMQDYISSLIDTNAALRADAFNACIKSNRFELTEIMDCVKEVDKYIQMTQLDETNFLGRITVAELTIYPDVSLQPTHEQQDHQMLFAKLGQLSRLTVRVNYRGSSCTPISTIRFDKRLVASIAQTRALALISLEPRSVPMGMLYRKDVDDYVSRSMSELSQDMLAQLEHHSRDFTMAESRPNFYHFKLLPDQR